MNFSLGESDISSHTSHLGWHSSSLLLHFGILVGLWVSDGFINSQDHARGLSGSLESVVSNKDWFPDEFLVGVADSRGSLDINSVEFSIFLIGGVLISELVQDSDRVQTSIISNGSWDDFKSLGVGIYNSLDFSLNAFCVLSESLGNFHFDSSTSSNNFIGLDGSSDDHDGIIE